MSTRGPGFWGYRWEGYSHRELYDQVTNNVKGAGAVEDASQAWTEFVAMVTESRANTERLLREAGVEWQGAAAESMSAGVSPLAAWAESAAAAGDASKASLQGVAEGFARTANSMPEPVDVPFFATQGVPTDFPGILAGQTDQDTAQQRAQNAHQHAVELMNSYTVNNQEAADTVGTFDEPESVGVSAQPKGSLSKSDGDVIDSSVFGDGGDTGGGPGPGGGAPGPGPGPGSGAPGPGSGAPGSAGPGPGGPGAGAPGPGSESVTDPARVTSPPPTLPVGGLNGLGSPSPSNPFAPVSGVLTDPVTGAPYGSDPRGSGGVTGRGGGSVGAPGANGAAGPGPGRGPSVGTGPLPHSENAVARGGGAAAAAAAGRGQAGFGPMGGGAANRGEDDKERNTPEYLRDYNDDFWDDTPPVAPPVIGEDDD